MIFLTYIKELKHGKIDAKWLNSLVLDLADNIGRNSKEKQKIEKLFHYPFSGNFSINNENDILNTNSNAWLYLLNLGNSEVSAPIMKEIMAILNR